MNEKKCEQAQDKNKQDMLTHRPEQSDTADAKLVEIVEVINSLP
jgi:hypothetical protein